MFVNDSTSSYWIEAASMYILNGILISVSNDSQFRSCHGLTVFDNYAYFLKLRLIFTSEMTDLKYLSFQMQTIDLWLNSFETGAYSLGLNSYSILMHWIFFASVIVFVSSSSIVEFV